MVVAGLLGLSCAHKVQVETVKPGLILRAAPRMGIPPLRVLLIAEITGETSESFYCPTVRWMFPDATTATETSDCLPYEARDEYRRRWMKGVIIPSPGTWVFAVVLEKGGRRIATAETQVLVAGDINNSVAGAE